MGNLKQSPKEILLNSLDATKVSVYARSIGNDDYQAVMLIKDLGIEIPGAIIGGSSSMIQCVKNCTDLGAKKIVSLEFAPPCPCEECNWEYGITINHKDSPLGVQTRYFPAPSKFYGSSFPRVECTDGFVDDDYVLRAENDILEQICKDKYRFVDAFRVYDLGDGYVAEDTISFTISIPGEDDIEVVDAEWPELGNLAAFLEVIQTAIGDDRIFAYAYGDDGVMLIGDPCFVYTVAMEGAVRKIYIEQKYPEVSFDVSYPPDMATATLIQVPRFPSLRGTDVYREFTAKGHHGQLSSMAYIDRPDPNANYCKYTIRYIQPYTYDLVGANHLNQYYQEFIIYIKEDLIDDLVWTYDGDEEHYGFNVDAVQQAGDLDWDDAMTFLCDGTVVDPGN